jgi:protein involved in polysaccharide export with SLBB domain
MRPGKERSTWQSGKPLARAGFAFALCLAVAGCLTYRDNVEKNSLRQRYGHEHNPVAMENYLVGCPDVLAVQLPIQPELNGKYVIGPDGRIHLGPDTAVRVEGYSPKEAANQIAEAMHIPAQNVAVSVADFRSQHVILFGEVIGWQRVVPYEGQETVLDLLKRTGGITRGAAPESIYVVRTHVQDGHRPEIFHVNLPAIVSGKDDRTNIRILPYDQIYVGETRRSHIEKAIPPCIRPFYQMLWLNLPDLKEPRK